MPGLCYYVPMDREPKLRVEKLEDLGFPHIKYAKCPGIFSTKGPDGAQGYFFKLDEMPGGLRKRENAYVGFFPDKRTWTKTPDGYWIGFDTDSPPKPIDVQIPVAPEGYRITLLDGNDWVMPIVRECDGETTLPKVYRLLDGATCQSLLPGYESLWDVACRIYDTLGTALGQMSPGGHTPLNMDEAFSAVALAFQTNYVIGEMELRALGLCAQDELAAMLQAMVDVPGTIAISEELLKSDKKKQNPSDTPG